MSDHGTNSPEGQMLTPSSRRMLAASIVQRANVAVDGLLVADALDAVCAGILRVAGVDDPAVARAALGALWAADR